MPRLYASYHKYSNKRRYVRPFLLLVGACLVALALAGVFFLHNANTDGASSMQKQAWASLTPTEAYPQGPLPDSLRFDSLLLEKSTRRLSAFSGGKIVRVYLVALGENPIGHKQFEGDRRTPEGRYVINDKNARSAYYKNLGISYPNAEDRKRAKALGKSPGGDIKIHGLAPHFADIGAAHRSTDWTYGCVAVTNPEMEELFSRTPVGVPIEIRP